MGPTHRLVVLFGGQSAEHDVSCVTARHVIEAVDRNRFELDAIGITRTGDWVRTPEIAPGPIEVEALSATGTAVQPAHVAEQPGLPVVVLPLLHGPMGEDGTVQGLLDMADVPYAGTGVLGSAVCMDKVMAKTIADAAGIAQLRWLSIHADDIEASTPGELRAELGPVVFVKPANMGSSVGVSRAASDRELVEALDLAGSYDQWIVVEEAVEAREIEVGVLGNRDLSASVPGEIVPGDEFYSYDDKYHDGVAKTLIPADLDEAAAAEVRDLAIRSAEALRVQGLARVDFFYEENARGFLLNEINTMPGFTPISMFPKLWQASGVSYPELVNRLVDLAIERHNRRRAHRSTVR